MPVFSYNTWYHYSHMEMGTPLSKRNQKATLPAIVEALLFYSARELSYSELAKLSGHSVADVKQTLALLQQQEDRGIAIATTEKGALMTTAHSVAGIIASLVKEEETKELSRAALETLSIVAYHGPLSRPEIDYIRGVNSTYSLRNLLIRGLIDKTKDGASFRYSLSMNTMQHMGIQDIRDLPQYEEVQAKVEAVLKKREEESEENTTTTGEETE